MPIASFAKGLTEMQPTQRAKRQNPERSNQEQTATLDLIQLKCSLDSNVKHPMKTKTTTEKEDSDSNISYRQSSDHQTASQVHTWAKKSKQLRNRGWRPVQLQHSSGRDWGPRAELKWRSGRWVGWAGTPGEAGQGHQGLSVPQLSPVLLGQNQDLLLFFRQDDFTVPEPYSALTCITV